MPRPRTGSVYTHAPHGDLAEHFACRITLPDGRRSPEICLPGLDIEQARARAASLTATAAREVLTAAELATAAAVADEPAAETADGWAERWFTSREERGLTSVRDDRGRWRKWVSPQIGARPMTEIATIELERLVEHLDASVRAGKVGWKTAGNVWGLVTKAFDDAAHSKALSLRVRADNPATGIRGPDRGTKRAKTYLFPAEFLALVSCERVPLRWRRLFAVNAYLYLRAGEVEALAKEDIDLDRRRVHVHRSIDRDTGGEKSTKTKRSRHVPIEPALVPLLELLMRETPGDRLLEMPPACDLADRLRKYLRWAGVTRAELFTTDQTRKQIGFHDAGRSTGITWLAIRGDEPLKIQQRAGHEVFRTTQGYIREAESLEHNVGDVFPVLPAALVSSAESSEGPATWGQLGGIMRQSTGVPSGIRSRSSASREEPKGPILRDSDGPALGSARSEASEGVSQRTPTKRADETNHRAGLAEDLARRLVEALHAGDLEAARVAHAGLGALIGQTTPAVVDLARERSRRRTSR